MVQGPMPASPTKLAAQAESGATAAAAQRSPPGDRHALQALPTEARILPAPAQEASSSPGRCMREGDNGVAMDAGPVADLTAPMQQQQDQGQVQQQPMAPSEGAGGCKNPDSDGHSLKVGVQC
jgi:hypothetical protein